MYHYYLLINNETIWIINLFNHSSIPYLNSLPMYAEEHMGDITTFNYLSDCQKELYNRIGPNEMFLLGLENNLEQWLNRRIDRPKKQ